MFPASSDHKDLTLTLVHTMQIAKRAAGDFDES